MNSEERTADQILGSSKKNYAINHEDVSNGVSKRNALPIGHSRLKIKYQTFYHFGGKVRDMKPHRKRVQLPNKLVLIDHKLRMNFTKEAFFTLLLCITIIFLSGCSNHSARVALETNNVSEGEAAIEKLTDQVILAKIVMEANEPGVRIIALEKLTNQSLLARIAIENKDEDIRIAAVKKLTDQTLLAKFAVMDTSLFVRMTAVEELTDQTLLGKFALEDIDNNIRHVAAEKLIDRYLIAKIAVEDESSDVREVVIKKLIDPAVLAKIANEKEDMRVQKIYKLIRAFDNVPVDHRIRLLGAISESILVLSDPKVSIKVGEIVSIKTFWSSISMSYHGDNTMPGEYFECSIVLKNLTRPLSHSWNTQFPPMASDFRFLEAKVNALDLFEPILNLFSQTMLTKVALEASDGDVGQSAVVKITDQSLLAKIAVDAKDRLVRRDVVYKLTDQSLLVKIVSKDEDVLVREAAQERLNVLGNTRKK